MTPSDLIQQLEKLVKLWTRHEKSKCDYDEGWDDAKNECADELELIIKVYTGEPKS